MNEATNSIILATRSASFSNNWIDVLSRPGTTFGFILGGFISFIFSSIGFLINHWLTRKRTKEERLESFRLKVYELRIQAAQTAYKYIFKIYRSTQRTTQAGNFIVVNEPVVDTSQLLLEARDWLDGQALILGEKVYQAVLFYFNSARSEGEYKTMNAALKTLKNIIKEDLVNLD